MKKLMMGLTLLMSFSSLALTCTSEDLAAKKLILQTKDVNTVTGSTFIRTTENEFVGTVNFDNLFKSVYTLYNQHGEKFLFELKTSPIIGGGHCRARVCPTPAHFENMTGKLIQEDKDDEYFTCF